MKTNRDCVLHVVEAVHGGGEGSRVAARLGCRLRVHVRKPGGGEEEFESHGWKVMCAWVFFSRGNDEWRMSHRAQTYVP